MSHPIATSYLGVHHTDASGHRFVTTEDTARFARRCGGTPRAPGIPATVGVCDCEEWGDPA